MIIQAAFHEQLTFQNMHLLFGNVRFSASNKKYFIFEADLIKRSQYIEYKILIQFHKKMNLES